MPIFDVEFEVVCSCGNSLTATEGTDYHGGWVVTVGPCEKCLDKADEDGYNRGLSEGTE